MVDMYRDLGFLLDGVFSLARTGCGKLTQEKIVLCRRMINGVMKLWRYLKLSLKGPKIHQLEDHLLDQMIKWNGIGNFAEDFVEQVHHRGAKEEIRSKGLTRNKAYLLHSNWEWQMNNVNVIQAKEEMRKNTERLIRRSSIHKRHDKKSVREDNRLQSLMNVESGIYSLIEDYIKRIDDTSNEASGN